MSSPDTPLLVALALAGGLAGCGSLERGRDAAVDGNAPSGQPDALDGAAFAPADAVADAGPLPATLVQTTREPWGDTCPRGGVRVLTALDLNGNRAIDAEDETVGVQTICNVYPVSVSLGPQHGCALASNGGVWCWGADDVGQLGDYGESAAYAPRPVAGVESALALAVGGDFACVILPTTGVRCWGRNDRGQGGHGIDQPVTTPSCVTKSGDSVLGAVSLALGAAHACAAFTDGTVACWGGNDARQLGDGTIDDRNEPGPVLGVTDAQAVVAGGRHSCALLHDTTVRCWGANDEGQLGNGTTTAPAAVVTVGDAQGTAPLAGVAALAAGDAFTCALMQDETLSCWGANADCQLGLPSTTARALWPVAMPLHGVQSVAAGGQHACAVLASGKVVCWGRNDVGQVGVPAGACRPDAITLPLASVATAGAGRTHSCAVDQTGLWCWGDDSLGQLGIGVASATRSTAEPQLAAWPLAL